MELLVNKQGFVLLVNQASALFTPCQGADLHWDSEAAGKDVEYAFVLQDWRCVGHDLVKGSVSFFCL